MRTTTIEQSKMVSFFDCELPPLALHTFLSFRLHPNSLNATHRRDTQHLLGTPPRLTSQQHFSHRGSKRYFRHPLSQWSRQSPIFIQRLKGIKNFKSTDHRFSRRRREILKPKDIVDSEGFQGENDRCEIRSLNFWNRSLREGIISCFGVKSIAFSGFCTAGSAGALEGRGLGYGGDKKRFDP